VTSLLYVVRPGDNEELRYSLRSVATNLPHDGVFIAGSAPPWLTPDVGVIPTLDRGAKYSNILDALEVACDHVPDEVVYFNDDQFVMAPVPAIPVYHRGRLADRKTKTGIYGGGFAETEALLRQLEVVGELLNYELHLPMPIRATRMAEALARARAVFRGKCLHPRTLYGNLWHLGGEQLDDVKVHGSAGDYTGARLLSTNDTSFASQPVGEFIRSAFPDPCRYER
jgi:hypothetical protein